MQGTETSWLWAVGLITSAIGLIIGASIGYLLGGNKKQVKQLQDALDKLGSEFDSYRSQVGEHFLQTSRLVDKMTSSYRDVYEHLATGSEKLCQDPATTPRLEFPETTDIGKSHQAGGEEDQTPPAKSFSDAETDNGPDDELDEYMGEAPQVPNLKMNSEFAKDTDGKQPTRH